MLSSCLGKFYYNCQLLGLGSNLKLFKYSLPDYSSRWVPEHGELWWAVLTITRAWAVARVWETTKGVSLTLLQGAASGRMCGSVTKTWEEGNLRSKSVQKPFVEWRSDAASWLEGRLECLLLTWEWLGLGWLRKLHLRWAAVLYCEWEGSILLEGPDLLATVAPLPTKKRSWSWKRMVLVGQLFHYLTGALSKVAFTDIW